MPVKTFHDEFSNRNFQNAKIKTPNFWKMKLVLWWINFDKNFAMSGDDAQGFSPSIGIRLAALIDLHR